MTKKSSIYPSATRPSTCTYRESHDRYTADFIGSLCQAPRPMARGLFGLSLASQCNISQIAASVLSICVLLLVAQSLRQKELGAAIAALPLGMLAVSLVIGVSIVKASGRC